MINDRDLGIIGVGAFLSILCLLFGWPFMVRVAVGGVVLVFALAVALLRLGPDRIPLEQYLLRRIRRGLRPARFTFRSSAPKMESGSRQQPRPVPAPAPVSVSQPTSLSNPSLPSSPTPAFFDSSKDTAPRSVFPVTISVEGAGAWKLIGMLLAVVGFYFVFWLATEGSEQMASFLSAFIALWR